MQITSSYLRPGLTYGPELCLCVRHSRSTAAVELSRNLLAHYGGGIRVAIPIKLSWMRKQRDRLLPFLYSQRDDHLFLIRLEKMLSRRTWNTEFNHLEIRPLIPAIKCRNDCDVLLSRGENTGGQNCGTFHSFGPYNFTINPNSKDDKKMKLMLMFFIFLVPAYKQIWR